jgi:hypothetical protein
MKPHEVFWALKSDCVEYGDSSHGSAVNRGGHLATQWMALIAIACTAACTPLGMAQPADSPRPLYQAVVGAGTPVCDAYVAPMTRYGALGVKQPKYAQAPPFEAPDIGIERYGPYEGPEDPLLIEVRDFLWQRDINPVYWLPIADAPQWRGTAEQLEVARRGFYQAFGEGMRTSGAGFHVAHFDLNNDGETDSVFYRFSAGGSTLLVLTADGTEIDVVRTERILKHPSRANAGWPEVRPPWPFERSISTQEVYPVADAYRNAQYGAFRFDGKFYVDFWWAAHPTEYGVTHAQERGALHVYLHEGETSREVCVIRMAPQ